MVFKELRKIFTDRLLPIYPIEEIESFFFTLSESILEKKRVDIALNPYLEIKDKAQEEFLSAISQLEKEVPIQYIIGTSEFCGYPFIVNQNVLIPRPETEELVQWIVSENKDQKDLKILDIGTGSGCIAISLAKKLPNAKVCALDISEKALRIAMKNEQLNNVSIEFIQKDILNLIDFDSKFDVIVSNPPYVRELEKEQISKNVLDYEPHQALFVEDLNPLVFYEKISRLAKTYLTNSGSLYFEINQYLGKEMILLLKDKNFQNVELRQDIFNSDRMIKATL